jgi:MoaA/NifB/PqqE/SkfB family radical SAM enzyme
MYRIPIVRKLIYNGCRYRLLKYSGRPGPLESISLEITHHCICRCEMCNIWQIPQQVPDLPLSDWTKLLSSPALHDLCELDITGGEPFLRKDLADLLKWICRSKSDRFPKLKTVAITTNGILTDRVIEVTTEIAGLLAAQDIDLVLACGLDAVGELHDQIRNLKGAWQRLSATIAALQKLRETHPNLILGIKTTVIPMNVHLLHDIASFAREEMLFTIISPCIITANRFGNTNRIADLTFDDDAQQALREFYQSQDFAWTGHREAVLKYLESGKMEKPCSAGFNTVFVRHTGEVYPCPVIPIALGNMKQESLTRLLRNRSACQFRRKVGSLKECRTCTEPGLERLAWPFEGFTCLRYLYRLGREDFDTLAGHMGLYKYL